jgi:glycosyltransferase involved in cell wall biosynthesis
MRNDIMSKLSVVLPAYNEELMVGKTCRVLAEVLTKAEIPYELVVVNDGSGDRTWEEIQKAGEKDANVTGVLFSRNFGKEAAIFGGFLGKYYFEKTARIIESSCCYGL